MAKWDRLSSPRLKQLRHFDPPLTLEQRALRRPAGYVHAHMQCQVARGVPRVGAKYVMSCDSRS